MIRYLRYKGFETNSGPVFPSEPSSLLPEIVALKHLQQKIIIT